MFLKNNKKFFLKVFFLIFFVIGTLFLINFVQAQTVDLGVEQVGKPTGLPSDDVRVVIARIIRVALGFLGTLAVVLLLYGGYLWMTAGGNEEKISQAKKIIINTAIGLAIILSSYAFTSFIIRRLLGATNGGGNFPDHCYDGIKNEGEIEVDCGGTCGACGVTQPNFPGGNVFYVNSLPGGGAACVRNVRLAIVFNKNIDIGSLQGNVILKKKDTSEINGKWNLGEERNIAIFVPEGTCGGGGGNDCLESDTDYILEFKNSSSVKSVEGLTLNCTVKAGCGPVNFKSGSGVDRTPPTIKFLAPSDKSSVEAGAGVPVKLEYADDSGIQQVTLYQNDTLINSQSLGECKKTGTIDFLWPTTGFNSGLYKLNAISLDWAGQKGVGEASINLLPFHCYNDVLEKDLGEVEKGPPACGGECGKCGGDSCQSGNECASGYCDTSGGQGKCVDKMRIGGISPLSGAPGTYVSISGYYFGDKEGEVYFSKNKNPLVDRQADWVKANLVNCAGNSKSWTTSQILVEVPNGAIDGPLKVITDKVTGRDNLVRQFIDTTNDEWGSKINDFKITSEIKPSICSITPDTGVSGDLVQISGKNFGLLDDAKDYVLFGNELKGAVANSGWADTLIKASVPYLDRGILGVKVVNNGVESNGIRFTVNNGENTNLPLISNFTPLKGAKGEYITLSGKNFGSNIGAVWFKTDSASEALLGEFSFPEDCQKNTWRDDQIIVKFPQGKGEIGKKYYIQIKTADNKISRFSTDNVFTLEDGAPGPGVCKLSPVSGPVPFPEGQSITISGEYFGTDPDVYFWKTGANPQTVEGRLIVPKTSIISAGDKIITLRPPEGISTGPVVVYKTAEQKISNPAGFTIFDCVKNNNTCTQANQVCCAIGQDKGVCRANTELCEGATLSAGYVWRFSTADIPLVPQVVERCDDETNEGKNLPTPSPSIQWDSGENEAHHNVCRSALVTVEFNVVLDQTTVNGSNVVINKCSSVDKNNCVNPVPIKLASDSFALKIARGEKGNEARSYLSISPEGGLWSDTSWYQVVFSKAIKAAGKNGFALASDKPCTPESAYCFVFRTDARDCRMKAVVVTPYSYWTSILEEPMKYRVNGVSESNVVYYGNGLSDQKCIMMDTSNFTWNWNSSNARYGDIYGEKNKRSAEASALANTIGVGLTNPENAVNISASAQNAGKSYTGDSPLTIDLNNPEVLDYWPKCLEACTNAEVAVRFNTSMSLKNLPGSITKGAVQLLKCNDENCLNTISVLSLADVALDANSNYTILKFANSVNGSNPLEPNTLYQVILSATSTNPLASTNQLWSSATFRNPGSWSRPYNKVFTWRFRTKKDKCSIDRVDVLPSLYYASSIKEKVSYNVEAYSSPDACSSEGQKLDPWTVNWQWSSSDQKVATVSTFNTKGKNSACTNSCTRKGSDIPAGSILNAVCGNGKVEAGEDCDSPDKTKGCSLSCLFTGSSTSTCGNGIVEPGLGEACDPKDSKTAIGCSNDCRHVGSAPSTASTDINASICGNGMVGSGEDCDNGISENVSNQNSALNCSEKCLHVGTRLSAKWCFENRLAKGGFTTAEYEAVCSASISQCGDKIQDPSEDPGCDGPNSGWNSAECNEFCLKNKDTECTPNSEGCDELGRHKGSSLLYSKPAVCGDASVGIGEDAFCESELVVKRAGLIDPWSLVTGVGQGNPSGEPPTQSTDIKALTTEQTKGGPISDQGKFAIACGYKNDMECKEVFGDGYGVGGNSCCYAKPQLKSTYPATNSTNVCPNTYLEAVFDTPIDPDTLKDNILIAQGADKCDGKEDVTSLVAFDDSGYELELPWYKKVFVSIKIFVSRLWGNSASAAPTKWCIGEDAGGAEVVPVSTTNTTTARIVVKLTKPLAFDKEYAIILKEGIKTERGVSIGLKNGKNISWNFATRSTICELNSLEVEPTQWSFSKAGATTTLQAKAKTNNGTFIQGIPNFYDWEYIWGPQNNEIVSFNTATTSFKTITAQNRNGEIDVRVSANITSNKYSNVTGLAATGKSHVIVFLCQNPWPPKDLYLNNRGPFTIFPFEDAVANNDGFDIVSNTFNNTSIPPSAVVSDGYFNFSTYYCADNGEPNLLDDLPYLRGTVQVTPNIVAASSSLKRFFFTNTKNSDAIGIQVFSNPKHLTVEEWYSTDKASGGQGFTGETQSIEVNGYKAITDGNNIYVDALNYSSTTKSIYSNIYLFSINANAKQETRKVFEELIKNLKFNINVTNYGYCGTSVDNPSFEKSCKSDLDCQNGQICSATVDKLKRNYQRLRDLRLISFSLEDFANKNNNTYPDLNEGTFLRGQTFSVWPSWPTFGNSVGNSLPVDPINKLGKAGTCATSTNRFCTEDGACPNGEKCVLHEAETGWSIENRRFSFACATSSYAYRYLFSPTTSTGYTIRAHFENSGITINNQDSFSKDFVNTNKIIINSPYGICNQDQEISTLNQGVCGDGRVNSSLGEECDPPGRVKYGECNQNTKKVKVDVCTNNCKWTPSSTPEVDCSFLSKCGNSVVEIGEDCDDGGLNGRYNHCTTACKWPPQDPPGYCGDAKVQVGNEVCDIKAKLSGKDGLCVSGLSWGKPCDNNNDCKQKDGSTLYLSGTCKLVEDTKVQYGKTRSDSCNWDCQSFGPYCGDGKVQSEFGEECDGSEICSIVNQNGNRYCSAECKWSDKSPIAWWRFDDAENKPGVQGLRIVKNLKVFDSIGDHTGLCAGTDCPEYITEGKSNSAFEFNGSNSIAIPHSDDIMPFTALSVEAWVKPNVTSTGWARVMEKGGYKLGGGYGLQLNPTSQQGFALWGNDGNKPSLEVYANSSLPVNVWTHILGVYERKGNNHNVKIYINGILENTNTVVTSSAAMTPTTKELIIGRAGNGGEFFTGAIDEIKIYNRVLSAPEILERFKNNWACSVTSTVSDNLPGTGICGDGRVDAGEACDRGLENNLACTPPYGASCTYCSKDCRNIIDVQSQEYCGNGRVEGPEACDTDPNTKIIYSKNNNSGTKPTKDDSHQGFQMLSCAEEVQATSTFKKGTKSCVNRCLAIQANCTICGAVNEDDKAGVFIRGSLLNALDPSSQNPLLGSAGEDGAIDVTLSNVYNQRKVGSIYWVGSSSSTYYLKPAEGNVYDPALPPVKLNSDPRCSFAEEPNYKIYFNKDDGHSFDFPVVAKPATWQYDQILSPVIDRSKRPDDIRIVATWVNSNPDFYGGFVVPSIGITTTTVSSTGSDYYFKPSVHGIWYHGFGYTPTKTNVRSFTVDGAQMIDEEYIFYLRVPQARLTDPGIYRYKDTSRLKVDVYIPENDSAPRHFAKPTATFYLSNATNSDNNSAPYWHVFNIKKNGNLPDRIIPINKIVTRFQIN